VIRMKIGKILIAGVAATVVSSILGMVTCGGVFNWVYKLEPINVWKNMEGPPGIWLYVGSLILHVIFAYVYALLQKGIPGKNKIVKGLVFGLYDSSHNGCSLLDYFSFNYRSDIGNGDRSYIW
jgi:hypothetical protein